MKEDWPEILDRCLEDARDKPFVWGERDCCLWAADVVLAMTGIDHASEFRGKYKTAIGATKALKRIGKGNLEKTMDAKLERTAHPRRGDFVFVPASDGTDALGISVGVNAAVMDNEMGLVFITLGDLSGWKTDG